MFNFEASFFFKKKKWCICCSAMFGYGWLLCTFFPSLPDRRAIKDKPIIHDSPSRDLGPYKIHVRPNASFDKSLFSQAAIGSVGFRLDHSPPRKVIRIRYFELHSSSNLLSSKIITKVEIYKLSGRSIGEIFYINTL